MTCYICDREITQKTEADEHIIINAAGGRLKSKNLICLNCNSLFGSGIDSALANQLNGVANMLMIQRQRGEPQPIISEHKSSGEQYLLAFGGRPIPAKPTISKKVEADKMNIAVTARTESELRSILKGIRKKYPHFDVDEAMKRAKWHKEYFNDSVTIDLKVGGKEVFRAVCKCAMNFFIFKGGDSSQIQHLIPFVEGKEDQDVVWLHYHEDLYELQPDECCHLIHLVGNPKEKVLYCYVDYFNTHKYLVLLGDSYSGKEINEAYCYDVLNVSAVERRTTMSYNRQAVLNFFSNKDAKPFERVKKSFDRTLAIGLKRQDEFQRSQIIEKAIQRSLGRYPQGTTITEEILEEVVREIAEAIAPYLIREPKHQSGEKLGAH